MTGSLTRSTVVRAGGHRRRSGRALARRRRASRPVARALMANLVVFRDCPARRAGRICRRRSSGCRSTRSSSAIRRALILLHFHGGRPTRARRWRDRHHRPVRRGDGALRRRRNRRALRVRGSLAAVDRAPPHARRRADVDLVDGGSVARRRPLEALITMGRQLLYDSRRVARRAPGRPGARAAACIRTEYRGSRGRELAAAECDAPGADARGTERRRRPLRLSTTSGLRISHGAGRALAWLLAGWLASRLDWTGERQPVRSRVDERRRGDEILELVIGTGREPSPRR